MPTLDLVEAALPFGDWRRTRGQYARMSHDFERAELAPLLTKMRAERALELIAQALPEVALRAMSTEQRQAFAKVLGLYADQIRAGSIPNAHLRGEQ